MSFVREEIPQYAKMPMNCVFLRSFDLMIESARIVSIDGCKRSAMAQSRDVDSKPHPEKKFCSRLEFRSSAPDSASKREISSRSDSPDSPLG